MSRIYNDISTSRIGLGHFFILYSFSYDTNIYLDAFIYAQLKFNLVDYLL